MYTGRQLRGCSGNDAEPVLVYSDNAVASEARLDKVNLQAQRAGCGYHLELIRVDANVNKFELVNSKLDPCQDGPGYVGCGSGSLFITSPGTNWPEPRNILVQNTVIGGTPNYWTQMHSNIEKCVNYKFIHNTWFNESGVDAVCPGAADILWRGNLGPRSSNPAVCKGRYEYNVSQHAFPTAMCGSTTDKWVEGPSYSTSNLGVTSDGHLTAGSPAIDFVPTTVLIDRDGQSRPFGPASDAGADEYVG
jgi:hypothetical protein